MESYSLTKALARQSSLSKKNEKIHYGNRMAVRFCRSVMSNILFPSNFQRNSMNKRKLIIEEQTRNQKKKSTWHFFFVYSSCFCLPLETWRGSNCFILMEMRFLWFFVSEQMRVSLVDGFLVLNYSKLFIFLIGISRRVIGLWVDSFSLLLGLGCSASNCQVHMSL